MLFLCTGNICRSPMAEVLLQARCDAAGIDATVSSAGLLYDGAPASGGAVEAMAGRGLDLSGHRSRILRREHLAAADLVLGMARMHVREAVVLDRARFGRTFTLKELVRRAEATGPRRDGTFDAWLGATGAGRRTVELLGEDPADDVADPIGRPLPFYERTADELSELVDRVVEAVWRQAGTSAGVE